MAELSAADGLPDVYIAMGQTAENVAEHLGISRERQDEFGVRSQNRAEEAMKRGFFEQEITPYELSDGSVVSVKMMESVKELLSKVFHS